MDCLTAVYYNNPWITHYSQAVEIPIGGGKM